MSDCFIIEVGDAVPKNIAGTISIKAEKCSLTNGEFWDGLDADEVGILGVGGEDIAILYR
jgi:hypothetical protein